MNEKYKKKLMKQLAIMTGLLMISILVTIVLLLSENNEHTSSFMLGLTSAFSVFVIIIAINYFMICRNPEKLKKEMIKDMDERNILIQQKVQASSFLVYVILIAFITIVLAFFDPEKMLWMSGILWLGVIVKLLLYAYYKRKL